MAPPHGRAGKDLWLHQVQTALPGDVDALFQRLPEAARADVEVVKAAVLRSARCLGYASLELRADAGFMIGMVAQSGIRLQFASETLRGNRDVVLKAVKQHGAALQYASELLRGDREVVLAALAAYKGDPHTHPFRWAAGFCDPTRTWLLRPWSRSR
ncbi:unnamed protein product [Prorocentrum cordatum]|uniref:DUF4116 domain-containing protein n=1 Tax=Prorocentrum cordatum TaxID=2364126 RepID=A0ABN9UN89_9DINO|nr:unnamed protein product [Polarella glacialis]